MTWKFLPSLLVICHWVAAPLAASAQTFSHALPTSVTPGTTSLVNVYGGGLANAKTLWTTFPATVELAPGTTPSDTLVTFQLTVPADAPVGMFGARVVTDAGISDARPWVVDDLPIVLESGNNITIDQAQAVELPIAIDGVIAGETSDYFSFPVVAGQRVAFEVVGHRLGAGLDPLVRILGPDRREIVSHDNDEGLGFDIRFDHVFKDAGTHYLELRDTRYQGGGNWAYHLRMGDFPVARVAYPAGGTRGRWVSIAFPGRMATDVPPMATQVTANPIEEVLQISARGGNASAWVPFVLDDQDQQLELEPNDDWTLANGFVPGRTLNGRLQTRGDVDCFRFTATKGQAILFAADTRRISSPADLYLRVLNHQGGEVAVVDDAGTEDAKFTFTAPEDGEYTLVVEDLNRRGGLEFIYRILTQTAPVDYSLLASTDRLVISQGSHAPLLISAARAGYNDPIQLQVQSPHDGIQGSGATIPAGAGSEALTLRVDIDAPLGIHTLRLAGVGTVANQPLTRGVGLANHLSPKLDNLTQLPGSLVTDFAVLVTPPPFFRVSAEVNAPAVARFAKTPVTVHVAKEKFFDEEVAVEVANLPPNVAVAVKPVAKGTRSIQLEMESNKDTPLGRFPVFFSGTSNHRGRAARTHAEVLVIDIQPAFALTLSSGETRIAKNGKSSVTVLAKRHPSFAGPIEVELKNLPAGVTAPKGTIPEKQDAVTVELAAAGDAAAAKVENLNVVGTANPGTAVESVTSPNGTLIVE